METEPLPYYWAASPYFYGLALLILLFIAFLNSSFEKSVYSLREKMRQGNIHINIPNVINHERIQELLIVKKEIHVFLQICIVILFHLLFHSVFQHVSILGYLAQILLTGFLLFVFQNILPRFLSCKNACGIVRFISVIITGVSYFLKPFNRFLLRAKFINIENNDISIDKLLKQNSKNNSEEQEYLKSIIRFGRKNASEIMQARIEVIALDITEPIEKVLEVINESGYSRIPVYDDTFDNIRGILYIKDLLPLIYKGADFSWQEIIRAPFFVPESKKIDDLLKEFQRDKVHMAIVIDEYGGCSGIVTMEDILEEIVGDIMDEYDDEEERYIKINDNTYVFDGKTELNDFYKHVETDSSVFDECKGDAETLAGLMLELKGEIPDQSEKINWKNFTFSIEAVDDRRIKKIKVVKHD